jgi:hypothetical protein
MPTPVSYLSGNTLSYQSGMVKKGTVGLNLTSSLTGNYRWWNGVEATASQYLIYSDTYTTGASNEANVTPAAWSTPDLTDQSLLNLINTLPDRIGQTAFTTLSNALIWLNQSGEYFLVKNGYENLVTSGLTLNLDAGWTNSYSGTTSWRDISGNGKTGTLTNGPAFNSGNTGSIYFDGTDDFCVVPSSSLNGLSSGSISVWVKFLNLNFQYVLSLPNSGGNNGFDILIENGKLDSYLQALNSAGSTGSQFVPKLDIWYNIVTTYDGTTHKLFVNGILISSVGRSGTIQNGIGQTFLGRFSSAFGAYSNNYTSNAQLYNRALSQTEILQNYQLYKNRFGYDVVENGLVLNLNSQNYVSYRETGTSWFDLTGNNNTGTLTNGPTFNTTERSIVFDGADDYVTLGDIMPINAYTKCVVFNISNIGSANNLISGSGGGTHYFYPAASNYLRAGHFQEGAELVSNTPIVANKWYHGVVTFSTSSGFVMYQNGVNVGTNSSKAAFTGGNALFLGSYATSYLLNGKIANAQIYNRVLTPTEVLQSYYQGNIVTNGLISALDGGNLVSYPTNGTSFYDLSETYTGGTLWNGPTFNTANGGFLVFDGTDDYVSCGIQLSGATQFSFTIVFKTTDTRSAGNWYNNPAICGTAQGGGISGDFLMAVRNGYLVQFDELIPNGGENNYETGVYVSDGNWKILQVTKSTSGIIKFFVNGLYVGQVTGRTQPLRFYDNSSSYHPYGAQWEISRAYWLGSLNLNGSIALQHLYNRTLTDTEVIQNFNSLKSRYGL